MMILSGIISLVGLYLLSYRHHLEEVRRYEIKKALEDFHSAENRIKKLHSKGEVFKDGDEV